MNNFVDELLSMEPSTEQARSMLPSSWRSVEQLDEVEFAALITALDERSDLLCDRLDVQQWHLIFAVLLGRCEQLASSPASDEIVEKIADFYAHSSHQALPKHHLLTCLTALLSAPALERFASLLRDDPPVGQSEATVPFLPLMRPDAVEQGSQLFPALFDCLQHPQIAPLVIDLANFQTRERAECPHPGADRVKQLIQLLSGVTRRLEEVQNQAIESGSTSGTGQASDAIHHAIELAISLCDALALIGDEAAIAALSHTAQLRHRRLQLEAASALARLGDEDGKAALLQMAAHPSLRMRVMRYAEELGIEDEIDEQFTTGAALAEGELVTFLATQQQYGVAPTSCELVEATTMYWPGYEEPRECYLFRFAYSAVDSDGELAKLVNFGIAGPVTHAFRADTSQLPTDDAWSIFAGWHAEHDQISHRALRPDSSLDETEQPLAEALLEGPYEQVEALLSGQFFEDRVLVARAVKAGQPGIAVSAADGVMWIAQTSPNRPLSAEDGYSIYKGRKLLASFNN